MVTQRAVALLLSLLRFMSLPNKRLGGPGKFLVFVTALTLLVANDKMFINTLLPALLLIAFGTASSKSKAFNIA